MKSHHSKETGNGMVGIESRGPFVVDCTDLGGGVELRLREGQRKIESVLVFTVNYNLLFSNPRRSSIIRL